MVTTYGKVNTARKQAISIIHSLLREKEILDINEIEPRGGKPAAIAKLNRELLRAQKILDDAPNDPSPSGEKKG